jgi:HTH-like domain
VAAFIAAQGADHGIPAAACCRALGVPRSWFYKWKDGDCSPRQARRERLKAEIARLFAEHKGKRGSPMIAAGLRDLGWRVSKNTVAALMAEMGLAARPKKRRKGTTRPGKGRWRAPDLVKRNFPAEKINQKWYGDGTDIGTDEGKLYLLVTWNHLGVSSRLAGLSAVASLQVEGDGVLRGMSASWAWDKWPVLGRHERAAEWLSIWADLGRAPRTIDAYARAWPSTWRRASVTGSTRWPRPAPRWLRSCGS